MDMEHHGARFKNTLRTDEGSMMNPLEEWKIEQSTHWWETSLSKHNSKHTPI